MKRIKILIIVICSIIVLSLMFNIKSINQISNATIIQSNGSTSDLEKEEDVKNGTILYANNLYQNTTEKSKIEYNTKYLQSLIDTASTLNNNKGGGVVKIPAGTYYFAPTGANVRKNEDYVIKAKNNVTVEGAGINEKTLGNCTILKPYGKVIESDVGGIDMFYFNDYADYGTPIYLENADFKNFIIDGENTEKKGVYNTSGKGFMFLLVKNCDYENVIVRNTEATGFGMDCPINCTIKNCIAINCGRGATISQNGGSGFGIGTGYSNEESLYIINSKAFGNKKYGFFFEHQGRFCGKEFDLYPAKESKGFVVANCVASGNTYDFGGVRANDVTYENCISTSEYKGENATNIAAFDFIDMSRRVHMVNCKSEQKFTDVVNENEWYYEPVYWALNQSITTGTSNTEFSPNRAATRAEAITLLWRMAERPGEVVYSTGKILNDQFEEIYTDVPSDAFYVDAAKWAKNTGIVMESKTLEPYKLCTRAEFLTMLWRYAGNPVVNIKTKFTDVKPGSYYEMPVKWAESIGILKGTANSTFSPYKKCNRAEIVTFLYRYSNAKNSFSINYNLGDGIVKGNPLEYIAGKDTFTLKNPTRVGYTFLGWTGSNYSTNVDSSKYLPKKNVTININDVGNKTYTANWIPNTYIVKFSANGGKGKMEKEYFIYDLPQTLLENKFTRNGYIFDGWNTKYNGTGKSFENMQTVENLIETSNGEITLYAQWKKVNIKGLSGRIISLPVKKNLQVRY